MTNKERTQAIKAELKKAGYSVKLVSVRSGKCGYSDSTDITVKDLSCNINEIRKICASFECIDYDQYSGEILAGGNTYISVQWDWELINEATEANFEKAKSTIESMDNSIKLYENAEKYLVLCKVGDSEYDIAEFKQGERCGRIIISPCSIERMTWTLARAYATSFTELLAK